MLTKINSLPGFSARLVIHKGQEVVLVEDDARQIKIIKKDQFEKWFEETFDES